MSAGAWGGGTVLGWGLSHAWLLFLPLFSVTPSSGYSGCLPTVVDVGLWDVPGSIAHPYWWQLDASLGPTGVVMVMVMVAPVVAEERVPVPAFFWVPGSAGVMRGGDGSQALSFSLESFLRTP